MESEKTNKELIEKEIRFEVNRGGKYGEGEFEGGQKIQTSSYKTN